MAPSAGLAEPLKTDAAALMPATPYMVVAEPEVDGTDAVVAHATSHSSQHSWSIEPTRVM